MMTREQRESAERAMEARADRGDSGDRQVTYHQIIRLLSLFDS